LFAKVTEIASANTAITVEKFEHSFDQPSIIARLPGKSDELGWNIPSVISVYRLMLTAF
jgi:hypothetical protein